MQATLKRGLQSGLNLTWTLGKVIFPITLIVTILQYTPVLPAIIEWLEPLMGLLGLSGEAAVPLVLGNALNLYAGIAAIVSFDFTVKEVFILAMMLSFSHNLFIESTVAAKVGVKFWVIIVVRVGLAITAAMLINLFWNGGQELAQYGLISNEGPEPTGWMEISLTGLETAILSIIQLAAIVIPLMVVMQWLRDNHWMDWMSQKLSPFTKLLGVNQNASMTLVAGLTIGLAYGAGMMIQAVKEDGVSKKDMTLVLIFLVTCHAVVEDTLVFIPLGIPVWPLLVIRLITAIVLTMTIAYIWNRVEKNKDKDIGKDAVRNEHTYDSI
ncbi:nucleoside recognition domain-containing protein [Tenuibacillus multivorans]|uniref:Nucleoside recognition n=1 Tax=Tenuibacillus multivorans TaxID=237069 RepID=A0A1H0DJA7_9BACI|nr:nucleoside recognition domain-containing protein [Tenuibacillus multivorans]GEL76531.1 putative membrane protein YvoD [Tenuibacillus multivorans]SDN70138.1 Nucleoside recognition [Tenuibacillus multivorans]